MPYVDIVVLVVWVEPGLLKVVDVEVDVLWDKVGLYRG